jgi:zinc transport system substrate-binding protein
VELLQDGGHDGHGHAHAAGNPHFWLDPVIAAAAVRRITRAVASLRPERADSITARARSYLRELERLDSEIEGIVRRWKQRRYIGDHSSWVYFARRYGLQEAGVIESVPGREVSARELSSLIALMREKDIDVVFADKRKSTRSVEILAEESGARIAPLDPLGASGIGYIPLMRWNVREMAKVMR